ncbi:MAG: transcription termination factor Rho [Spirochaetia bacterium]|nr:transcription termination factor Rho [Spirochaetia bacterium]
MAEEVKQDSEKNPATDEKKSVKVVLKKRVKKTAVSSKKDDSTEKLDDSSILEKVKTEPKKKRTTRKKVEQTDNTQLELELDPVKENTPHIEKKEPQKKRVQIKKSEGKEPENDTSNEESVEVIKEKKTESKKVYPKKKNVKAPRKVDNLAKEEKNIKISKDNTKTNSNSEVETELDAVKNNEASSASEKSNEENTQKVNNQNNSQSNSQNNNRKVSSRNNNNNNNNNNKRNNSSRNNRNKNNSNKKYNEERFEEVNLEENPDADKLFINDYYCMSFDLLREKGLALGLNQENIYDYKRQEIITEILKSHSQKGGALVVEGTLEVLPDGYGFLRSSRNSYISGSEDIYVSSNLIRHNALRTGDLIYGQVKTPRDTERFYGLHRILLVNNDELIKAKKRPSFDSLIPRFPDERMRLENSSEDISTRLIDMFCPIGKGQRSLIVAPPRTGKTVLMQKIANAISENYPEIALIVLLVDERPEEVTDMKDNVRGEVIASTFDEQATRHVQVAEMAIEKAKRMVEANKDVVILLDSITRLARAYNQTVPASGKILSGGVDSNALHKPKRFFGAARNMEGGGSLTIIATALIETGSRMDEVIFEEFKGTGNNEIVLDRRLSDRRIFPSINLKKSGTRRDDLLIPSDEASRIWIIRNAINDMDEVDQTPFLIDKMRKAKNNEAFFKSINTAIAK